MQGRSVTTTAIERMLNGLRLGMTRRAAAAAGGFSKTTLYRMLEADDGTLVTAMENAEAEAEGRYTAIIARATNDPKNWTAAAWWLERRHPNEFGRRDRVEVKVNVETIAARVAGDDFDVEALVEEAERLATSR